MTTITALPTAPSRADPENFRARADALLTALPTFVTQANQLSADANTAQSNAADSAASAAASSSSAAASASAAAVSAGVSIWVSGTTYAIGDNRFSPANKQTYRRLTAGAGTIDPASDPTNWTRLTQLKTWLRKTAAYTCASWECIKCSTTGGAWSLTFPALPSDGDEVEIQDVNGTFHTNNLTILANGKNVMGDATSLICDTRYLHVTFVYDATLGDWRF